MDFAFNRAGLDQCLMSKDERAAVRTPDPLLERYDTLIHRPLQQVIRDTEPSRWGLAIARRLKAAEKSDMPRLLRAFLDEYLVYLWDALRTPLQEGSIPRTAMYGVHQVDLKLPHVTRSTTEIRFMGLEELVARIPQASLESPGKKRKLLRLSGLNGETTEIPLGRHVYHKGGVSRLLLKLLFGSDLVASELPLKDWDIIVPDAQTGHDFMAQLGEEDFSGVETCHGLKDGDTLMKTMNRIMDSRDSTMNLAVLGFEGLYYCDASQAAATSGVIEACNGDHGIYGRDFLTVKDADGNQHRLIKGRVFERLVKMVVDRKARAFRIPRENLQINMGPSLFMGIARNIGKPDASERILRFYELLNRMGQIEQFRYIVERQFGVRCETLIELLDQLHRFYPFVMLENRGDEVGVARWLLNKLLVWFRDRFKYTHGLSEADHSWIRIDSEQAWEVFDLEGFEVNPAALQELEAAFPAFLARCRERNQALGGR
ncbi:hypothetical protein HY374_02390 [Candidatus Berkelbacteria bacterium]|nr:hypothetical protein [Candidatus Berkelbacteria bacterium]